jgi:hypothetical protein
MDNLGVTWERGSLFLILNSLFESKACSRYCATVHVQEYARVSFVAVELNP